jgi:hypothetical protein
MKGAAFFAFVMLGGGLAAGLVMHLGATALRFVGESFHVQWLTELSRPYLQALSFVLFVLPILIVMNIIGARRRRRRR